MFTEISPDLSGPRCHTGESLRQGRFCVSICLANGIAQNVFLNPS